MGEIRPIRHVEIGAICQHAKPSIAITQYQTLSRTSPACLKACQTRLILTRVPWAAAAATGRRLPIGQP